MSSTESDTDKDLSQPELRAEVEKAREALAWTLDAIEDKLNVPKRVKRSVRGLKAKAKKNPAAAIGVALAAAAVVGGGVFAIIKAATRD